MRSVLTSSKLNIVKSKLRASMEQDRLEHKIVLFVEQELANHIDLNLVIDEFKNIVLFDRRMGL